MSADCWKVLLVAREPQDHQKIQAMLSQSRRKAYQLEWWPSAQPAFEESSLPDLCNVSVILLYEEDFSTALEQLTSLLTTNRNTNNQLCTPILLLTNLPANDQNPIETPAGAVDLLDIAQLTPALLDQAIWYACSNHELIGIQEQRIQARTQELRTTLESLQMEVEQRKHVEEELRKSSDALRQLETARRKINEDLEARVAERTRALLEEQNWLRTLIENAPSAILFIDREGKFTLTNPETSQIFDGGMTGSAYDPKGGYTLHHPDGTPISADELPFARALQGAITRNVEILVHNSSGREVFILTNSSPVYGPDQEIAGAMAVMQDITELKHAELESQRLLEELRTAQQVTERAALEAHHAAREARTAATRLEAIINSLTDAVFVYDQEGTVQLANSFAIAILGFDPIRMPRSALKRRVKITQPDGNPVLDRDAPYKRAERGELVFHDPLRLTNSRGRTYNLLSSALPFYIGRERYGVVVVWTDVTRLERLQEEIHQKSLDLQAEQLQHSAQIEVQRQLIRQREMERIQIARDLHEGLLQDMIAMNFSLVEAMGMDQKTDRLGRMQKLQETLTQKIRDLRAYCNDLRPPVLAPFGLEKTIRSHLDVLRERHPALVIHAQLTHDGKRLSEETRIALFRIYQELVTNVIRHAQSTELWVEFTLEEKLLTLKIADNGIGFDVPSNWVEVARQGRLGIIGARERIETIGGTLTLDSLPGAGTQVTIQLPIND